MKIYIDLSNLMEVDFLTGIQRVVRESVVRMLQKKEHEFVLLIYEYERNAFRLLDNDRFLKYFADGSGKRGGIPTSVYMEFHEISPGTVFFDIDSVWNSRLKRSYLFPILRQNGVRIVTQLYDLIPITHPQFCRETTAVNFMAYIGANLQYADLMITSAQATVKALDELSNRIGIENKRTAVVPLGCDFYKKQTADCAEEVSDEIRRAVFGKRYILMVGTIEPRKNHSLMLDALEERLAARGICVVFAGRIGWDVSELERRIKNHPLLNESLFFFDHPDDTAVDYLYKNAFAVAFPTFNEGFGLPVIEAFERGVPVIASDIDVLHEVAGDFADYFDPTDKNDLIRCVERLVEDSVYYRGKRERLKQFVPFTWDQAAEAMMEAVVSVGENIVTVSGNVKIRQAVCLTARNDDLLATLSYIEHFMPFISEMLVCCPDKNVEELRRHYRGRLELKFLTDSEILGGDPLPRDHAVRNFFLRCRMMKNPAVDDVFLMTDDDYRPMCMLSQENFIKDGKYMAFYCYDLGRWQGKYEDPTSFDKGMWRSLEFLRGNGYPTMMYSSHQMQVIDKRIFNEMISMHPDIVVQGLCDWSIYFNYGLHHYPFMYQPVPYISMCWPGERGDWNVYVKPPTFLFENHYHFLYRKGGIFEGFSEEYNENTEEENARKAEIFSAELKKQMQERSVYDSYCENYWRKYREMPSFVVFCDDAGRLVIHTPAYIRLHGACHTRIPFMVDRRIIEKAGSAGMFLSYWFTKSNGSVLTIVREMEIDADRLEFQLNVKTPSFSGKCLFNIKIASADRKTSASAGVRGVIV